MRGTTCILDAGRWIMEDINQIKKTIRALLISAKNGLTPQQLQKDYESIIGKPLPVRELGYRTLSDLVIGMPDVIWIERTHYGSRLILRGVPDKSCRHVANLVSRQRCTKPYSGIVASGPPSRPTAAATPANNRIHNNINISGQYTSSKMPKGIPDSFKIKLRQLMISYPNGLLVSHFHQAFQRRFGYYVNPTTWGYSNMIEAFRKVEDIVRIIYKETDGVNANEPILVVTCKVIEKENSSLNSLERGSPIKHNSVPLMESVEPKKSFRELVKELSLLLEFFPNGLLVSDVSLQYKKLYNQELPLSSLGYSSVLKLLHDSPNGVCDVKQIGDEWIVFVCTKGADSLIIPNGFVKFLKQLIKRQTPPVLLETFPLIYKGVTNNDIPYVRFGYQSLVNMLESIPGIDIQDTNSGRIIMINDMPALTEHDNEEINVLPEYRPSVYTRQHLECNSKPIAVYVTYVKTPSYLCIQIIRTDTTQALDSLHDDMAMYYNSIHGGKCDINDPKIGQPCCARFNNDGYWYRGEVVGFPQVDTVELLYVDYGNRAVVPRTSIKHPKAHYLSLPAQGIMCRLANIKPPGPTWSRRATSLLFEMTKDKALAAIVTNVSESCVVSVCLCDTTTDKDIHINDLLVAQGLGIFKPDNSIDVLNCDSYQSQAPPAEHSSLDANIRLPFATSNQQLNSQQTTNYPQAAILGQTPINHNFNNSIMNSTAILGQAPPTNHNYNNNIMNPFLPFPMLPNIPMLPNALSSCNIQLPVIKPNKTVLPPPGFENFVVRSDPLSVPLLPDPVPLSSGPVSKPVPLLPDPVPLSSGPVSKLVPLLPDPVPLSSGPVSKPVPLLPDPVPLSSGPVSNPVPLLPDPILSNRLPLLPDPVPLSSDPVPLSSDPVPLSSDPVSSSVLSTNRSTKQLLIEKIQLPSPYTLHILRHDSCPFVIAKEISSWLWEADLLSFHLKRIKCSYNTKKLCNKTAPELFALLEESQSIILLEVLVSNKMELYSLNDAVKIVKMYNGPQCVLEALNNIIERDGNCSFEIEEDKNNLQQKLIKLQIERTQLLMNMINDSKVNDMSVETTAEFKRFMKIDREMVLVKNKLDLPTGNNSTIHFAEFSDSSDEDTPLTAASSVRHQPSTISTSPPSTTTSTSQSIISPPSTTTSTSQFIISPPSTTTSTSQSIISPPSTTTRTSQSIISPPSTTTRTSQSIISPPSTTTRTSQSIISPPSTTTRTSQSIISPPSTTTRTSQSIISPPSTTTRTVIQPRLPSPALNYIKLSNNPPMKLYRPRPALKPCSKIKPQPDQHLLQRQYPFGHNTHWSPMPPGNSVIPLQSAIFSQSFEYAQSPSFNYPINSHQPRPHPNYIGPRPVTPMSSGEWY